MKNDLLENSITEGLLAEEQKQKAERNKRRYRRTVIITVVMLLAAAVSAVLVATQWMPVLRIYGSSMEPTLMSEEIVVTIKTEELQKGDIIAFYHNNKILIKRVMGTEGDKINITTDGTVFVNNERLTEPYISEKNDGDPDIQLPYKVPEGMLFVMGDNREKSVDSRHTVMGCVAQEQVLGKLVLRIWPAERIGCLQ